MLGNRKACRFPVTQEPTHLAVQIELLLLHSPFGQQACVKRRLHLVDLQGVADLPLDVLGDPEPVGRKPEDFAKGAEPNEIYERVGVEQIVQPMSRVLGACRLGFVRLNQAYQCFNPIVVYIGKTQELYEFGARDQVAAKRIQCQPGQTSVRKA